MVCVCANTLQATLLAANKLVLIVLQSSGCVPGHQSSMTLGLPRRCEHSGQHPLHAAQVPHSKRAPATATSSSPAALGRERAHLQMCLLPAPIRAFAASRLGACRVFAVSDPSEVCPPSHSFSGRWLPPSCMLVIH